MAETMYAAGISSFVAEGAVEKGDLVQLGTAYPQVKKTAADTAIAIGIAQADAATTEAVQVALFGVLSTARSSAAITAGAAISPAADGEIQDAAAADQVCGVALAAAAAADADVPCLFSGPGWLKA